MNPNRLARTRKTTSWKLGTIAAFALVPPITAIALVLCADALTSYLRESFVHEGKRIPDAFDVLRRILQVTPILLSFYGVINGLIFARTKPFKWLTLIGVFMSLIALIASMLKGPH